MTVAELQELFDPEKLFVVWVTTTDWTPGNPSHAAGMFGIADHSPKRMFDFVVANGIGGLPYAKTEREAVYDLTRNIGAQFHHHVTGEAHTITTIDQSWVDKVSRSGCHTSAAIMVALARSINIPAYRSTGWLWGCGHDSAFFPSVDLFMPHGDNIYVAGGSYPVASAFQPMAESLSRLTRFDSDNAYYNARFQWLDRSGTWQIENQDSSFCAEGFDATFASTMLTYLSFPQDQGWADAWKQELINRTGCSGDAP